MDEKTTPGFHICGLLSWTAALACEAASLHFLWLFYRAPSPTLLGPALALHLCATLVFLLPALFGTRWHPPREHRLQPRSGPDLQPAGHRPGGLLPGAHLRGPAHSATRTRPGCSARASTWRWARTPTGSPASAWARCWPTEIAIEPVVDVLTGDDPDLKRGAVKLLKRMATPGAVGLLRQCLSDPFPEVRFYAHSALSDLEDEHTNRIKAINETLQTAPSAGAWRTLGREYRAYADSGLADEVARRQHLEESRAALSQSLALEPGHAPSMLLLGQVLLSLERNEEAAAWFDKCLAVEETEAEARLGLAQIAFQQRDLKALAAQARAMARSGAPRPTNPDALALHEFWSGVGEARRG